MNKNLLILDDDLKLAKALANEFTDRGYQVTTASGSNQIPPADFDYAILDLRLSGEFGLNTIEQIKQYAPHCKIIVLSGYGSIATAVEAMKKGAIDYLRKPSTADEIELALLGSRHTPESDKLTTPSLSEVEHEYIDHVLTRNSGNITKAAKDLGLHRQSLQRKLKKYS